MRTRNTSITGLPLPSHYLPSTNMGLSLRFLKGCRSVDVQANDNGRDKLAVTLRAIRVVVVIHNNTVYFYNFLV